MAELDAIEPAAGDAVIVSDRRCLDPELTRAMSVCRANGYEPLAANEVTRLRGLAADREPSELERVTRERDSYARDFHRLEREHEHFAQVLVRILGGEGRPAVTSGQLGFALDQLEELVRRAVAPVPMLLSCPARGCGRRHIDEGEWATKPHHTHACQHCGHVWRPAIGPTVGVRFLPGFRNGRAHGAIG